MTNCHVDVFNIGSKRYRVKSTDTFGTVSSSVYSAQCYLVEVFFCIHMLVSHIGVGAVSTNANVNGRLNVNLVQKNPRKTYERTEDFFLSCSLFQYSILNKYKMLKKLCAVPQLQLNFVRCKHNKKFLYNNAKYYEGVAYYPR